MSRTDNTRPYWIQVSDPLNQRFKKVGSLNWTWNNKTGDWDIGEWHFKPMTDLHGCNCCSQKRIWFFEERTRRTKWRKEKQDLVKRWYADRWFQETLCDY